MFMGKRKSPEEWTDEVKDLVGSEYIFIDEYSGGHKKNKSKA